MSLNRDVEQTIYKRESVLIMTIWRALVECVETPLKNVRIDELSDRTELPVTSYFISVHKLFQIDYVLTSGE